MKKSFLYISAILVLTLGIFGCAKDDPPPPGQNTWYPGTNPNIPTQPSTTGTKTFWIDESTCGFRASVTVSVFSWADSTLFEKDISTTYESDANCLNSNNEGARFDLPEGYYTVSASGNSSVIEWDPFSLYILAGECNTYKLWCN